MSNIHPSAIVDSAAELGDDVTIGPYCVISGPVVIGDGTRLVSHVCIDGNTRMGKNNVVYPFASLGFVTQDLKYDGGNPGVLIGDGNTFREYTTVNTATFDGDDTIVGNNCHVMAYSHVAHDCIVGDNVIMANAATLAGHVIVEDQAIIGGLCGVHQFVRVGRMSIMGGCSKAVKDIPPFMMTDGNPLEVHGLNLIGLKRNKVSHEVVKTLKNAFKFLYRQDLSVSQAVEKMKAELEIGPELEHLMSFIEQTDRGLTT